MVGPQPTGPVPDLPDLVRRHAPGLHRTAVMLLGDDEGVDLLVARAFRRAEQVWGAAGPPASAEAERALLLEELVRGFLRHGPDRDVRSWQDLDAVAGHPDADPGDVLDLLRPWERAAAVLREVERWSPRRTAEAVHRPYGRVRPVLTRTTGARPALEAVADRHPRPRAEAVAGVLAALAHGTEHRPPRAVAPAPAPGGAPQRPRPWTWRVLAAAMALGLVVWVSVLAGTSGDAPPSVAEADTVGPTLTLADGSLLRTGGGGDLAARGWVLDAQRRPPVEVEGLRLVEAVPIDLRRATDPLRIDTRPRSGAALFGVLWCDIPALDANLELPVARLSTGGRSATLPCAGTAGEPPVQRLTALPPALGRGRTTALVSWSGDVPGRGRALLATYTEVGAGPARAPVDEVVPPVAGEGTVVLDGTGPAYQVRDLPVHHERVRIGAGSRITAWAGEPGLLTVQVDGTVVTDDGDLVSDPTPALPPLPGQVGPLVAASAESLAEAGSAAGGEDHECEHEGGGEGAEAAPDVWRLADPELRAGYWLAYGPGRARTFTLPEAVRPDDGQTRVVTVSVRTNLPQRAWQVQVSAAEVVEEESPPLALADVDAPRWIGGHRLVAAWRVPNDGVPHALVDPGLRPGRRFLLVDTPAGTELGAWGVIEPHVATTRGAAELTVVRDVADAFDASIWRPGDQLVRVGASTRSVLAGSGTGVLAATVPAAPGPTPPSTVLVYQPVPYDAFDFAAAPPMGVSVPAGGATTDPVTGTAEPGTVVAGRWTREDLDEEGRLTVDAELTGRTWLRLTTEGKGRVRVLEGGRPAVWLPDGWWSSWTAEPVVTLVRVEGTRMAGVPGQPFELLVEGHEERFEVEVLVRDDAAGGLPGDT